MSLTIPDDGEALSPNQTTLFQEIFEGLVDGIQGLNCVLHGGAVTAQGSPDMTLAVAKGGGISNNLLVKWAAGNATIGAADALFPRIDLVVINSSGTIATRAGTAAEFPKPPNRTANDIILALVFIPVGKTAITTSAPNLVTDCRLMKNTPTVIDVVVTAVTVNTSSGIQTYYTLVVPNGMLLTGRSLRMILMGDMLFNSGSPTNTFLFSFGGTTLWTDVGDAFTAGNFRKTWMIDAHLVALTNTSQLFMAGLRIESGSTAANPTTGECTGGSGIVRGPFYGTSAVDCDAADRTFLFRNTMSVSNAADEFSLKFAKVILE